jgi:hypothetical protein
MTNRLLRVLPWWLRVATLLLVFHAPAFADAVQVRYPEGTLHGFLVVRDTGGRIIAAGDYEQTVQGDQVTGHVLFQFKDGSINEETVVFSQKGTFHLLSDHQVQKGPSFPHPIDLSIDVSRGEVTVRSKSKEGKEETATEHMDLPADLYNGLVSTVAKNISPSATENKVSLLVTTPKPRLVKLVFSSQGEDRFLLGGFRRKAQRYEIKIELGGVAGVVAPLVGKQPPNLNLWIVGGKAPTFCKQTGPMFADGPIWTIELVGPTWPKSQRR